MSQLTSRGERSPERTDDSACQSRRSLHCDLLAKNRSCSELERRSEAWRPWRAYAAMYLWNGAGERSACGSTTVLSRSRKTPIERNLVRERTVMSYVTATLPPSANKR